jgi:hypothetical protein
MHQVQIVLPVKYSSTIYFGIIVYCTRVLSYIAMTTCPRTPTLLIFVPVVDWSDGLDF